MTDENSSESNEGKTCESCGNDPCTCDWFQIKNGK